MAQAAIGEVLDLQEKHFTRQWRRELEAAIATYCSIRCCDCSQTPARHRLPKWNVVQSQRRPPCGVANRPHFPLEKDGEGNAFDAETGASSPKFLPAETKPLAASRGLVIGKRFLEDALEWRNGRRFALTLTLSQREREPRIGNLQKFRSLSIFPTELPKIGCLGYAERWGCQRSGPRAASPRAR